jgi:hypothetical protein
MRRRRRGEMRTPGDVREAILQAEREIAQSNRQERQLSEREVASAGRVKSSAIVGVSPQAAPHSVESD